MIISGNSSEKLHRGNALIGLGFNHSTILHQVTHVLCIMYRTHCWCGFGFGSQSQQNQQRGRWTRQLNTYLLPEYLLLIFGNFAQLIIIIDVECQFRQ